MECVQKTHTHVTEYIGGRCTSDGVKGGIGIPGLDSFLVGFSTDTEVTGLDTVPPDDRPPANTMLHWAFDTMVGIGTRADRCSGCGSGSPGGAGATSRSTPWFLRAVAVSGVAAIVALECGWIVTEVGRQPWIVYEVMRTEDAVTGASGIWVTFARRARRSTRRSGRAAILVLRTMARRWREGESTTTRFPTGPRAAPRPTVPGGAGEHRRRRRGRALGRRDALRGLRRRRLRRRASGRWSPAAASAASARAR